MGISLSTQPVPVRAARSRFSWSTEHRQQPQDSPNSQHLPSVLLYSWAGVGKTTERFTKPGFSCWHPCQAATEPESGWSLSHYYRGMSIRASKLYAILTTKTSESITDLTEPHNALDTQSSPPYTSTHGYLSANSQVSNLGLQPCTPAQHSSGLGQLLSQVPGLIPGVVMQAQHSWSSAMRKRNCVCPSLTLKQHEASCKADKHWQWACHKHPKEFTQAAATKHNHTRLLNVNYQQPQKGHFPSHFPLVALLNWGALFAMQAAGKASACPSAQCSILCPLTISQYNAQQHKGKHYKLLRNQMWGAVLPKAWVWMLL